MSFLGRDKSAYGRIRKEISEKIRYLDKPFYVVRDCEPYFFENYFSWMTKMEPRILLFANTEISSEIEGNTVNVRAPKPVKDKLNIFIYPTAPYGEHRGRKLPLADETWEKEGDLFSLQFVNYIFQVPTFCGKLLPKHLTRLL